MDDRFSATLVENRTGIPVSGPQGMNLDWDIVFPLALGWGIINLYNEIAF
jgi:hypothetical protein